MYSEKIEKLIELAIADGELTAKEKNILFRKAEEEGIDLDEFEMVFEARLFEKNKNQVPVAVAALKSDKYGDVKKCPSCGATVENLAIKCVDCDTEFRNVEVSENITIFFEKLDEVEATRETKKKEESKSNITFSTILIWLFLFPILLFFKGLKFLIKLLSAPEWSATDIRKEEVIMNFPVPVSREGTMEFLAVASSKITALDYTTIFLDDAKYNNAWNVIWLRKMQQIDSIASISMKGDSKAYSEVQVLMKGASSIVKENTRKIFAAIGMVAFVLLGSFTSLVVYNHIQNHYEEKYDSVVVSAKKLIANGKYKQAEQLTASVDEGHALKIRSEIQLTILSERLKNIESLLNEQDIPKLKMEFEKIKWVRINNSSDVKIQRVEESIYREFLKKKEALNDRLPYQFRIQIESANDL